MNLTKYLTKFTKKNNVNNVDKNQCSLINQVTKYTGQQKNLGEEETTNKVELIDEIGEKETTNKVKLIDEIKQYCKENNFIYYFDNRYVHIMNNNLGNLSKSCVVDFTNNIYCEIETTTIITKIDSKITNNKQFHYNTDIYDWVFNENGTKVIDAIKEFIATKILRTETIKKEHKLDKTRKTKKKSLTIKKK